ncbi:unnamed protein product [Closterium sp. NIES-53]
MAESLQFFSLALIWAKLPSKTSCNVPSIPHTPELPSLPPAPAMGGRVHSGVPAVILTSVLLIPSPIFPTSSPPPSSITPYQHLPWGGEFTAESLQFFSPALIWAKLPSNTYCRVPSHPPNRAHTLPTTPSLPPPAFTMGREFTVESLQFFSPALIQSGPSFSVMPSHNVCPPPPPPAPAMGRPLATFSLSPTPPNTLPPATSTCHGAASSQRSRCNSSPRLSSGPSCLQTPLTTLPASPQTPTTTPPQHLPWGGEFTAESLQFFSPALLWAKLPLDADVTAHVLPAFKEYLQVRGWLTVECVDVESVGVESVDVESVDVESVVDLCERCDCMTAHMLPAHMLPAHMLPAHILRAHMLPAHMLPTFKECLQVIEGFLFGGSHELGTKGSQDYSALFLNPPPPTRQPPTPPSQSRQELIRIPVCGSHQLGSKGFQDYSAAPLNPPQPPNLPPRQEFIEGFLFAGSHELGSKGFLDYFPDYRQEDGSIAKKRSMKGKAYSSRPWDAHGKLIL